MKQTNKIFTALDLELNQNHITGPRIIQIGAVVGNISTGEIIDELDVFINPHQLLEPSIIKLTKINQEDVNSGISLEEGYSLLEELHKRHNSFINPIVWGQGDVRAIKQELHLDGTCFGRREIDAKTLYVSWRIANDKPASGGLSRAMANMKLQFKGQAHNAYSDAFNTFFFYRHMIQCLKSQGE